MKACLELSTKPQSIGFSCIQNSIFLWQPHLESWQGEGASFIWLGIWTANEALMKGFRWILGDGNDIVAVQDQWLRYKSDFKVDNNHIYEGRSELVSSYFLQNSKQWDVNRIYEQFTEEDAKAILAIHVPQRIVNDKVVWVRSKDGFHNVKTG